MKCSCCEKEIKDGEFFYVYKGEFYCNSCTKQKTITYYSFNKGDWISNETEEVIELDSLQEYIKGLEEDIQRYKKRHWNLKCYIEELEKRLEVLRNGV